MAITDKQLRELFASTMRDGPWRKGISRSTRAIMYLNDLSPSRNLKNLIARRIKENI